MHMGQNSAGHVWATLQSNMVMGAHNTLICTAVLCMQRGSCNAVDTDTVSCTYKYQEMCKQENAQKTIAVRKGEKVLMLERTLRRRKRAKKT